MRRYPVSDEDMNQDGRPRPVSRSSQRKARADDVIATTGVARKAPACAGQAYAGITPPASVSYLHSNSVT